MYVNTQVFCVKKKKKTLNNEGYLVDHPYLYQLSWPRALKFMTFLPKKNGKSNSFPWNNRFLKGKPREKEKLIIVKEKCSVVLLSIILKWIPLF